MKIDLAKKYGLLCVNFVNADSTEDAVISFLRNLQRCFSFSLDFYEKMRRQFPSIITAAAFLSEDEKRLLDIILKKNEIVDQLNKPFKLINYCIESYDPRTRTMNLMSLDWNRDSGENAVKKEGAGPAATDGDGFLQTLKLLGLSIVDGPVTIKIDAIRAEIENLLGPIAAGRISYLIRIAHEIEDLILKLGESSYEKIELLAEEQREIFDLHNKIAAIQSDCDNTLKMIIEDRSFHDIPTLVEYLEIYNNAGPHRLVIGANNRLLPVFPIDEQDFVAVDGIQGWLGALQKLIAYSLVEFLKSEKSRPYLKKCRTCRQYFMARQPKIQKFCTRQCRIDQPRSIGRKSQ
jgi:hypothetical protein